MYSSNKHKFKTETKPFITMLPASFPVLSEDMAGYVTQFYPIRHKISTFSEKISEGTFYCYVKGNQHWWYSSCPSICLSFPLALLQSVSRHQVTIRPIFKVSEASLNSWSLLIVEVSCKVTVFEENKPLFYIYYISCLLKLTVSWLVPK